MTSLEPVPVSDESAPAATTLFHLFADRFLPTKSSGQSVFSRTDSSVTVNGDDLAVNLFVVALWNLREKGLVKVEVTQKKVLFVKTTKITFTAGADGEVEGNIDQHLLGFVRNNKVTKTPSDENLVQWFVPTSKKPYRWVLDKILNETADLGYLTRTFNEKGALVSLEPVVERIQTVEAAAADLAARWQAFIRGEKDFYEKLRSHIDAAIHLRIKDEEENDD